MTLLYLVRHGETDWNLAKRIQGSTDIPLNDTGRAQATATGKLLARREWHRIVSSPLSRAVETARLIGAEVGIADLEIMPALAERAYGEAEGLNAQELSARFPPVHGGLDSGHVPGREERAEVAARVIPALLAHAQAHPGERVIVTTHGGVIRAVLNAVAAGDERHRGEQVTNGSIHSFAVEGDGLRLIQFDDPIEQESAAGADFEEQNPAEEREPAR
ncbi:phosphatase PhoE [soil metagenome]